ncbi:hypothetical protein KW813_23420, partial [Enterobacter quasiroggenkampii]
EINQRQWWTNKIYRIKRKAEDVVRLETYFANESKDEELLDEGHSGLQILPLGHRRQRQMCIRNINNAAKR